MQAPDPFRRAWLALGLLTAVGAVAVVVAVARLPEDDAGWGPNGRAWGDDEFWMDVLVQGVGWSLVAAVLGLSAFFLHRQRAAEIADRKADQEQRAADDRAAVAREARREVVAGVGDHLSDLLYEMWQLCGALRLQAEHDAAGGADEAVQDGVRARYERARDDYARLNAWLLRVPFRAHDPGYVEGPFTTVYEALEDFLALADRVWAGRPVTREAAAAVESAGMRLSETVARTSALTARWVADGSLPGVEP
jgi:hypothetical protein